MRVERVQEDQADVAHVWVWLVKESQADVAGQVQGSGAFLWTFQGTIRKFGLFLGRIYSLHCTTGNFDERFQTCTSGVSTKINRKSGIDVISLSKTETLVFFLFVLIVVSNLVSIL